jgi:hypothetical protein
MKAIIVLCVALPVLAFAASTSDRVGRLVGKWAVREAAEKCVFEFRADGTCRALAVAGDNEWYSELQWKVPAEGRLALIDSNRGSLGPVTNSVRYSIAGDRLTVMHLTSGKPIKLKRMKQESEQSDGEPTQGSARSAAP